MTACSYGSNWRQTSIRVRAVLPDEGREIFTGDKPRLKPQGRESCSFKFPQGSHSQ